MKMVVAGLTDEERLDGCVRVAGGGGDERKRKRGR